MRNYLAIKEQEKNAKEEHKLHQERLKADARELRRPAPTVEHTGGFFDAPVSQTNEADTEQLREKRRILELEKEAREAEERRLRVIENAEKAEQKRLDSIATAERNAIKAEQLRLDEIAAAKVRAIEAEQKRLDDIAAAERKVITDAKKAEEKAIKDAKEAEEAREREIKNAEDAKNKAFRVAELKAANRPIEALCLQYSEGLAGAGLASGAGVFALFGAGIPIAGFALIGVSAVGGGVLLYKFLQEKFRK